MHPSLKNLFPYSNKGDMGMHQMMIYNIVRGIKPKTILEIGIRPKTAVSSKAISQALFDEELDESLHFCCDIDPDIYEIDLPRTAIFKVANSNDLANGWSRPIDLLFIDGDHNIEQVRKDYENFSKYVTKNGFMFFHDTYPPNERFKEPDLCGTAYQILEDLEVDDRFEFVTFPYSMGLTVCRRKR